MELQDTLLYAVGGEIDFCIFDIESQYRILKCRTSDVLTSSRTTHPYTLEETKDMQHLISEIIAHHHIASNRSSIHDNASIKPDSFSGGLDVGARTVVCESYSTPNTLAVLNCC